MPHLPVISGQQAIQAFEVLDRGLLRSLIRDAFLSVDEFVHLLK